MDYPQIKIQLEQLTLVNKPSIEELQECLAFLYPLFLKQAPNNFTGDRSEWQCYWNAKELFEQILYDKHASYRQDLKRSWSHAAKNNISLTEFLNRYTEEQKVPVSDKIEDVLEQIYCEMGYQPQFQIPDDTIKIGHILSPYFQWLEKELLEYPYAHLSIVWNVLSSSGKTIQKAFQKWATLLEEKQLVEPHFINNMAQAIEWEGFTNATDLTAIKKEDFDQWIIWLDHENPVLRGVVAKCIGSTYVDNLENEEFQGHHYLPMTEMLDRIYQKQVEGKNVAGGFINGCCVDGYLGELENHNILKAAKFNVKDWVLKTAIDSPETESYIPGSQAFWFYIHEYLDYDANACHTLIDGECYWLAMMCATESLFYGSYQVMQPILERLQKEAPEAIANEIKRQLQIYLEQYHHNN